MSVGYRGEPALRIMILIAGLAIVLVHGGTSARGLESAPNLRAHDESQVLTDFQSRVRRYVELHQQLEATGPPIPISDNWAEITAAVGALADRIRAARATARRGDVFSPEVERWFRQALATCLEGENTEEFLAALEEEEAKDFVLIPQVNGRWPEDAPLASMPPHLLAVLPPLPGELQYRFMSHDLILWDVHANIIVDFITGALRPSLSASLNTAGTDQRTSGGSGICRGTIPWCRASACGMARLSTF
jgi:hypothetical protein